MGKILSGFCVLIFAVLTVAPSLASTGCHEEISRVSAEATLKSVTHGDSSPEKSDHHEEGGTCACVCHHHCCRTPVTSGEVLISRPLLLNVSHSALIFQTAPFPDLDGPFQPPRI